MKINSEYKTSSFCSQFACNVSIFYRSITPFLAKYDALKTRYVSGLWDRGGKKVKMNWFYTEEMY